MRRCPLCSGWWIRTLHGYEHNVGCPRKPTGGWLKEPDTVQPDAPEFLCEACGEPAADRASDGTLGFIRVGPSYYHVAHAPPYSEDEQDRDAAALRGNEFVPMNLHGEPDCPCDGCEDARRAALIKAYPELRGVGLSPKEQPDL